MGTLRIIAGSFRGRRIRVPEGPAVRPTPDRVREALFDILGRSFDGIDVLDLYAGSGALGLEALSRGAASADFVEVRRASLAAIKANIATLKVNDRTAIHRSDALKFAQQLQPGQYDVVFADPPYDTDAAARLVAQFRVVP